jgi:creatinine amidohydrolase/Fe(II)-dependent formamide hydrolase-like protein
MSDWREGYAILAARMQEIPGALARTAARAMPSLEVCDRPIRRVVATGIGSSAAHAMLLVHRIRRAGRDAVVLPMSSFLEPPAAAPDDVLVVFSQGSSPNVQLALEEVAGWRRVVLVTAVTDEARLAPLRAQSVAIQTIDGENEFGTLVRVIGPMTGYVAALRLAAALGGPPAPDLGGLADLVTTCITPPIDAAALAAPLAFVTSGAYGEIVRNLRLKVMEGMLLPMPPVWDALDLAHGPFQQVLSGPATFLALTRPDALGEADVLDRFASMLDPARHALVRLAARTPAPLALFEHEAMMNALLLRVIAARGVDQVDWPGRGLDAPLYELAERPPDRRLERMAWPEIGRRRPRLAIVPLGATEQHGPHLPFATDTLIADALAARLATRVGDAIALPALPLGRSIEHMGFPGTLDLTPATLVAVLGDILRSLARHGIAEAFVFSAHGGNAGTLRDAASRLATETSGLRTHVATNLDAVTTRLHAEAARFGVTPGAAGHHAGEVETSIMLALHPELVRDGLAPGYVTPTNDPQTLFYPDLRHQAPDGTVGDPRGATALRGERYLSAWVDVLETTLRTIRGE